MKKKKRKGKIDRGPIEQRVGDFCSVPRGGIEKKGKWEIGRGPIELWVEDFCSVPRGSMEKKKAKKKKRKTRNTRSRTDREVCREILPCATRWREKKKKNWSGTTCAMSFLFALCRRWRKNGRRQANRL